MRTVRVAISCSIAAGSMYEQVPLPCSLPRSIAVHPAPSFLPSIRFFDGLRSHPRWNEVLQRLDLSHDNHTTRQ